MSSLIKNMTKLPFKVVAIDLETTDADLHFGEVIQIGAVVVNEDLTMGKEFKQYLKPQRIYRNPEAMAVNKISEETLGLASHQNVVLEEFEKFTAEVGDHPILAAWGTHFDVVFLKETYTRNSRPYPFSYRCIDLKSIAIWEVAKKGLALSGGVTKFLEALGLKFEGEEHDALSDIKNVVRILQELSK